VIPIQLIEPPRLAALAAEELNDTHPVSRSCRNALIRASLCESRGTIPGRPPKERRGADHEWDDAKAASASASPSRSSAY